MVGADYDKIDFQSPDWYLKHEWNKEKERKFERWLIRKMWWSKRVRDSIISNPIISREQAVKSFVWNYGWKGEQK